MAAEDNKEIIRRFWKEIYNEGNLEDLEEVFATDFKLHDLAYGKDYDLEELRGIIYDTRSAVPGTRVAIRDPMLAEGDRVVTTFKIHIPLPGRPVAESAPAGENWEYNGMSVSHVSGGKIQEAWLLWESRLAEVELLPIFGVQEWRWPPWRS